MCVCALVCVLAETNVVLMLMRSHSSLAAVSGIEFLLGNRVHTYKQYILINHGHTLTYTPLHQTMTFSQMLSNVLKDTLSILRWTRHKNIFVCRPSVVLECVGCTLCHWIGTHTYTLRNNFVQLFAMSSEIQPSISPNQRLGEQAT